jgi:hypothetical protein
MTSEQNNDRQLFPSGDTGRDDQRAAMTGLERHEIHFISEHIQPPSSLNLYNHTKPIILTPQGASS